MNKECVNIQITPNRIITVMYRYEYPAIYLDNDIKINGWTIGKIVKIKYSLIRMGANYMEFILTDSDGIQKIDSYYYNHHKAADRMTPETDIISDAIKDFIQGHMFIFNNANWADYDAGYSLSKIKQILNSSKGSNVDKIAKIVELLK